MPKTTNKVIFKKIYKARPKDAKKYDFGLLLIIGGSEIYSGAPALSAMAAHRAGVDMVKVIAPKRPADIIAGFSPNLATLPLKGNFLSREHLPLLLEMAEEAKKTARGKAAVVIGGGIGTDDGVKEAVIEYLKQVSLPVVIDADAIKCLAESSNIIGGKNFLLTPHAYEFFVLTGAKVDGLADREKIKVVKQEAARLKTTLLLKGPVDIISDGGQVVLNKTGTVYMTKGGTGDTLAGICGALIARGVDIFTAAQAGAYINGKAGELAGKKLGESLTATDLIEEIHNVSRKAMI